MAKFVLDVLVGLVTALLTLFAKWQWPFIRSVFDTESQRQAAQISGAWDAAECFTGSNAKNTYILDIRCRGGRVSGTHTCLDGPDKGRVFTAEGSYKDQILTVTWMPESREVLESGTITAKLVRDRTLEGHGLYIEPNDGKVYTSNFSATKRP